MSDLVQQGLDWLEEQRKTHLVRAVTYHRGASSVEVAATVGATRFEVDDGYGIIVEQEMRDYIIAADELVPEGERTLPQLGDRIHEEREDATYVYEVMDLGAERHYRTCDPAGKTLRIHTKLVDTIQP